LSDLLAGQDELPEIHEIEGVPDLHAIVAGSKTPNPSELLGSEAMRNWIENWKSDYDFIVLDSAPVLPVTDAVTLNTLSDITVLLARSGMTEKPQVRRSYDMLRRGGKHFVGLVLNGLAMRDNSYYGYHGYRDRTYAYKENAA
jgi:capsular exopolysaccharide synthesis family protein